MELKLGAPRNLDLLSRREREILDILYRLGKASVQEVRHEITGQPHYSTVRATLRVLEAKGHVHHKEADLKYVYVPSIPKMEAAQAALVRLLQTFLTVRRLSYSGIFKALFSTRPREHTLRNRPKIDRQTGWRIDKRTIFWVKF